MDTVKISNEFLEVKIKLVGAELTSIKYLGNEKLWQGDEKFWKVQAPILFPIAGGIKNDTYLLGDKAYPLAKHGYVRYMDFVVSSQSGDGVSLKTSQSDESLKHFPFNFNFVVNYKLVGKSVVVEFVVENTDEKTMYYSIGSHEGYAVDGNFADWSIEFEQPENLHAHNLVGNFIEHEYYSLGENTTSLTLNYDYFNVDALVFPTINSHKVYLCHNGKRRLSVSFPDVNALMLWTKPNAPYICIEPWSVVPDYIDGAQDITQKTGISIAFDL